MENKTKVLLHCCCAPCASYPIIKLIEDNFIPVIYFYNPNIFPFVEYEIRRKELKKYSEKLNLEYFEGNYDIKKFFEISKGLEFESEKGKRCEKCFYLRLLNTANFAKKLKINYFTTTLSVSPHKNSAQIFSVANKVENETGIEFLQYNFKKQDGFKKSREIAKQNNMYRQNYCGCKFSIHNN